MNTLKILGVLVAISLVIGYHFTTVNSIEKRYKLEITKLETKHKTQLENMNKEVEKIHILYKEREDREEKFIIRERELLEDINNLEEQIKESPELIESNINNSFKQFMEEVYEETNISIK